MTAAVDNVVVAVISQLDFKGDKYLCLSFSKSSFGLGGPTQCLSHKLYTRPKIINRNKHSSLFYRSIKEGEKYALPCNQVSMF
jgi:hypothetical protein